MLLACCVIPLACCGDAPEIHWKEGSRQRIPSPVIKLYVENSGSMNGYMCDGSELKDAIYSYASALDTYADTMVINYINSDVIPFHDNLKNFIKGLTPANLPNTPGNHANSDIADMFEKMLAQSTPNTVSIFVSDCILDVPNGDANDYFVNRQIDIKNAIKKHVNKRSKDFGVEIIRLQSRFTGYYYYTHGMEKLTDAQRPYYMFIMGDKNILSSLNKQVPLSSIKHGYKNYYAYTSCSDIPFKVTNKYTKGTGKGKKGLMVTKPSNNTFLIFADMSSTLQDSQTILNTSNYSQDGNAVSLNGVMEVENDKDYPHCITCSLKPSGGRGTNTIQLVRPLAPVWLEGVNDETGTNIKANMSKTTGVKYIINGIAEAFNNKELCNINFVIK